MESDRIIWRDELQTKLQRSTDTIRRWVKVGKLPKPDYEMSRASIGWNLSTLHQHGIKLPQ